MKKIPAPLVGSVPPIVTPMHSRDVLDVEGLEKLIEHLIGGGVAAIFVLGSTGEGPSLSYRLRREMLERTCKLVKGRVPVLVGISDSAFVEAVGIAECAEAAGADAVVSAGPFYYPLAQADLQRYVEQLLAELALPLMLYNMPALTKVTFGLETVKRAIDSEKIIGLKDSSGDMGYLQQILRLSRQRPGWTVLVGPETLTAEAMLMGAHGGVSGGAMLNPRLYTELFAAAWAKDLPRVLQLHEQVSELVTRIYAAGFYSSAINRALKCALKLMGICDDFLCEPFARCTDQERERIKQDLVELKLLKK